MAWSLTSPLTGAAQTGFTSPTYTLSDDSAPDPLGKQKAVTALGGTQTGVTTHSPSSPFTITYFRTKVFKMLGLPDSQGVVRNVPVNTSKMIARKGVTPAANQAVRPASIIVQINIPAGAETYDAANVRALFSAAIGALYQQAAGLGDTAVTGIS